MASDPPGATGFSDPPSDSRSGFRGHRASLAPDCMVKAAVQEPDGLLDGSYG